MRLSIAGTLLLASLLAFTGIGHMPLEGHEIFVVGTVQQMHDRGDWIVPYFAGELRLTKPPLNYWLAGAVASASSEPFQVTAWHGRVPSAAAAVALAAMTIALGSLVGGQLCGVLSGLVIATSYGFLIYAHNARPEMVYAAACSLLVLAFFLSWRKSESAPPGRNFWPYAIWIAFGLATLAKGPHLPAMLLLALLVGWAWMGRPWKQFARITMPLRGILVAALIAIPWWIALQLRLAGTSSLMESQLGGALYTLDWTAALVPKYLFVTPQLLLPWVVLAPALLLLPGALNSERKLLLTLVVVPALMLNFAEKRHAYYMLPALMPIVVLASDCTLAALRGAQPWVQRVLKIAIPLNGLAVAILLVILIGVRGRESELSLAHIAACAGAAIALAALAIPYRLTKAKPQVAALFTLACSFALGAELLAATGLLVSNERYEQARLARAAAHYLDESTPLVVFDFSGTVPILYADRFPLACYSAGDVTDLVANAPRTKVLCLTSSDGFDALRPEAHLEELARSNHTTKPDYLLRVTMEPIEVLEPSNKRGNS